MFNKTLPSAAASLLPFSVSSVVALTISVPNSAKACAAEDVVLSLSVPATAANCSASGDPCTFSGSESATTAPPGVSKHQ